MKTFISKIGILPIFFSMQLSAGAFDISIREGWSISTFVWLTLMVAFGTWLGYKLLTYKDPRHES